MRLVANVVTGQVDVRAIAATLPDAPEAIAEFTADSDDEFGDLQALSTWHYLPVFVERDGNIEYSICEVHLDDDGCVASWTEGSSIAPSG